MMKQRARWWYGMVFAVLLIVSSRMALANPPNELPTPGDSSRTETPVMQQDSTAQDSLSNVDEFFRRLRGANQDTVATVIKQPKLIVPPEVYPLGTQPRISFGELADYPHTSVADHLVSPTAFDAVATTEYATQRLYSYHGLNPLAIDAFTDGTPINLRRLTFPQTMRPDLMVLPPYMFSSLGGVEDGEELTFRSYDSLVNQPYSDFFVRRGDFGLSLTQGRLFRPLPGGGGRSANIGFSFAQSDGRWAASTGNNRYLYAEIITPVVGDYKMAAGFRQYQTISDIQTAQIFQQFNLQRDDLHWRFAATLFRGDSVYSPLIWRLSYENNKQDVKADFGVYAALLRKSRTAMTVTYQPGSDSTRCWQIKGTLALGQLAVRSAVWRRPEYQFELRRVFPLAVNQKLKLQIALTGNDQDSPAPDLAADWSWQLGEKISMDFILKRQRIIPAQIDRAWPRHVLKDDKIEYSESGEQGLAAWWSNNVSGRLAVTTGKHLRWGVSGWTSYEQNYYYWRNQTNGDSSYSYQPCSIDARTLGGEIFTELAQLGPLDTRLIYGYKRAEDLSGARLPDYYDQRFTAVTRADLEIKKYNLKLHGSAEFMYWRAPTAEYTAYDTRNVYRTDFLGSATIKDFTIYWLAQNIFNYGYNQGPGYDFLGRTVMWGLHLRFYQ